MLERLRRLGRGARAEPTEDEAGVYTAPDRALHLVPDDGGRTACGQSWRELGLHRWASQWSLTDPARRCRRCDALAGPPGEERLGSTTPADVLLFGLAPSGASPSQRAALAVQHARDVARFRSTPPPEGTTFRDPPFVLATDPMRLRGTLEPHADRVVNEVHARVGSGARWHRIVAVVPRRPGAVEPGSRGFEGACGFPVLELEGAGPGGGRACELTTEPPPLVDRCRRCVAQEPSDRPR